MRKYIPFLSFLFLAFRSPTPTLPPKLIVLLSVDQMRADYLEKFDQNFEGGLNYLIQNGQTFNHTNHNHFYTTTAPGHATIATGYHPSNHGITNNNIYVRKQSKIQYCIQDTSVNYMGIENCTLPKNSVKNLLKPSLGDYIKTQSSKSKSYSVSLKDRASILMGGHLANRSFWFDSKSTQMVSTDFYKESFPHWVQNFKAKDLMKSEIESGWELESDFNSKSFKYRDHRPEEFGFFDTHFPHTLKQANEISDIDVNSGDFLWHTPFGDQFVLKFAKELIVQEKLGIDECIDVLTLSLSAADIIGHQFGPESFEIYDYYQKLDHYLLDFIQFLNNQVGVDNYLLVLTSDHGVAQFPESNTNSNHPSKRITSSQFKQDIDSIDILIQQEFKINQSTIIFANYQGVEPDFSVIQSHEIDSSKLVSQIQFHLENLNYIQETYSFFEIDNPACHKSYIQKIRNSHSPDQGLFIKILQTENYLIDMRPYGTTHGTPFNYDTHVPLIFLGPSIHAGTNNTITFTTDIVPTILDYLSIKTSTEFDGKILNLSDYK